MGTRAKIHIAKREEGISFSEIPEKKLVSIYNHYDGYPEGLGVILAEYLKDKKVVNGLGDREAPIFNGLGCLAASLIAELKDGPGDIYIDDYMNPHGWIDYEYVIWGNYDKDIWISIFDEGECIFVGKPNKLQNKYGG